jgi:hypothetical protein
MATGRVVASYKGRTVAPNERSSTNEESSQSIGATQRQYSHKLKIISQIHHHHHHSNNQVLVNGATLLLCASENILHEQNAQSFVFL